MYVCIISFNSRFTARGHNSIELMKSSDFYMPISSALLDENDVTADQN